MDLARIWQTYWEQKSVGIELINLVLFSMKKATSEINSNKLLQSQEARKEKDSKTYMNLNYCVVWGFEPSGREWSSEGLSSWPRVQPVWMKTRNPRTIWARNTCGRASFWYFHSSWLYVLLFPELVRSDISLSLCKHSRQLWWAVLSSVDQVAGLYLLWPEMRCLC